MKTAVLISGQMRSFSECVANLNWTVFRKLENPHFFISCADDDQAKDAYLLEGYFPNVHIERVEQPKADIFKPYPFSLCRHAAYTPTPNSPAVIPSILRQLWHYKRVWEFMNECQKADRTTDCFTTFVRCRPDLHFHHFDPVYPEAKEFIGPWKATCGGVNDRFSVMGWIAATAYFLAIDRMDELLEAGCPLHPETIQAAALELAGCKVSSTLTAEFMVIRLPGQGDHVPLAEYPGEMARFIAATANPTHLEEAKWGDTTYLKEVPGRQARV